MARSTIARRMFVGLLALFAVSTVAVTLALNAAQDATRATAAAERLAIEGRNVGRVASMVREFYMHQAHLALGMQEARHLQQVREAHEMLLAALDRLEQGPRAVVPAERVPMLRVQLQRLDTLLNERFLPAMRAGRRVEAERVHAEAATVVQRALSVLEQDVRGITAAITGAREQAARRNRRATGLVAATLLSALVLALVVAVWMTRGVTRPVGRLTAAASDLAQAPAGSRVPEAGPVEVAALGSAINRMLVDLEAQRRARGEAETLATLGRVAAGVAHEINNPLGVILGHARLIERRGGEAAEDAQVIARETLICQHIVRDLLDYARPGVVDKGPVDLGDVARSAGARAEADVEVTAPDSGPTVLGDARRLDQLVRNLLANAAAFGSTVAVQVGAHGAWASLVVADDGPGVDADAVERVFDAFHTTRADGVGLGLAIARSVATAHGGTLRAKAGPGGCFELRLPVKGGSNGADPGC